MVAAPRDRRDYPAQGQRAAAWELQQGALQAAGTGRAPHQPPEAVPAHRHPLREAGCELPWHGHDWGNPPLLMSLQIRPSRVRRDLAIAAVGLLVVIALVAAFQNGAMLVLDKLLPLVAIIFGFFFGHKATKP